MRAETGRNSANGRFAELLERRQQLRPCSRAHRSCSARGTFGRACPSSISISAWSWRREPPGLDDEQRHVAVLERLVDLPRHEPVQRALRAPRMPRRIDEHRLIGAAIQHAEHALARRVRLVRDDAELLADERVQQRRLADVRPADDRDEAAAALVLRQCCSPVSTTSIAAAASCSARRRLCPRPVV